MKALRKFAQMVHEALPADKRVYFIYTHKNGFDRFNNGLKANTELSYWIYKALRAHFPRVRFLRLEGEKGERIAKIRPQDVVVGHMGPTYLKASERTKRLIAFNPWSGDEERSSEAFNCTPKKVEFDYYDRAAAVILLTSEFNKQKYIDQPHNFWYPYLRGKRVRVVHQPIDLTLFRRIKWEYTTDDFLYIGNKGQMKGVEDAIELVEEMGRTLHLYGFDGKKIDHRSAAQVGALPALADFFIQPGIWEAQCVSILEAAARGFIPVVTEETGYPYKHPFLLRRRDPAYNGKILKDLLYTTPGERRILADSLHRELTEDVEHNNWARLTDVIVEEVRNLFAT